MCIRDRLGTAALAQGLEVGLHGDGGESTLVGVHRHHLHVCLLYTSDAADERSSVDLGGRRIIKKKKSTQEGGRWF